MVIAVATYCPIFLRANERKELRALFQKNFRICISKFAEGSAKGVVFFFKHSARA
jgi:hypothetical protein